MIRFLSVNNIEDMDKKRINNTLDEKNIGVKEKNRLLLCSIFHPL